MGEQVNLALECLKLAQAEGMTHEVILERAAILEKWLLDAPARQSAKAASAAANG